MTVRVIIADDHNIVREGLRSLLNTGDIEVIAEASDGRAAVDLTRDLAPDVVIMDIAMPQLNGIDAIKRIKANNPDVRVVVLSMHSDRRFVFEAFKAGASGYLLKECALDELIRAIGIVMQDQIYVGPRIATGVIEEYLNHPGEELPSQVTNLTSREREVLQLLVEGMTAKSIATSLNVSTKTVETHRTRVMDKLNIHSIAELTKYAVREGITSLN